MFLPPWLSWFLIPGASAVTLARPAALIPIATATNVYGIRQVHPLELLPTPAPFFRRADASTSKLSVDERTCGFQDGQFGNAFQCVAKTRACTNDGSYVGCCDSGSSCVSIFPTTCIDYEASITGACENAGPRTMCCAQASHGRCKTLRMLGTLTAIACGTDSNPGTILLEPTDYAGPSVTRTLTPHHDHGISGTAVAEFPDAPLSNDTESGTLPPAPPRPSTAAIVGGLVGALVVVAMVVCVAVWYVRSRADDSSDNKSEAASGVGAGSAALTKMSRHSRQADSDDTRVASYPASLISSIPLSANASSTDLPVPTKLKLTVPQKT